MYRVYNLNNEEVHIFQEREIVEFPYVTTSLKHYIQYFLDGFSFPNLLDYVSFSVSGLYDKAMLQARNNYILQGEKYWSAQIGIVNTFTQNNKNWKKIADHEIDLLNYISTEEIMEIIVGNIYLQWIYFLLQICGYCGGVAFLCHILYVSCKKKVKCPSFTLNSFKTVNVETKRYRKQPLDWSETSDDEIENGVPLRLRRYNCDKDDFFFKTKGLNLDIWILPMTRLGKCSVLLKLKNLRLTTPPTMYRKNSNIKL